MSKKTERTQANPQQDIFYKLDDHAFARKHPELWKLIKWFISGGIANGPELLTYMFCLWAFAAVTYLPKIFIFDYLASHTATDGIHTIASIVYSYMISTAVGYTVAFILNRKATFHADSNVALSTFLYIIMVIFTILANGIIGPAVTELVKQLPIGDTLAQILSKLLAMFIPGLWTYPCGRFIIHRRKKEPAEEEAGTAA